MKTQSTYAMLVNSKEKGRDRFEGVVYAVIALCTVAMALQGAVQLNNVRAHAATPDAAAPIVAKAVAAQPSRG
jgi:hypothetical protein